jgi:hypothetical protein
VSGMHLGRSPCEDSLAHHVPGTAVVRGAGAWMKRLVCETSCTWRWSCSRPPARTAFAQADSRRGIPDGGAGSPMAALAASRPAAGGRAPAKPTPAIQAPNDLRHVQEWVTTAPRDTRRSRRARLFTAAADARADS